MDTGFVTSRGNYIITRERTRHWTKYIVWNGDGEELERVSSFEEAKRLMDHYIELDAMAGDIDYE